MRSSKRNKSPQIIVTGVVHSLSGSISRVAKLMFHQLEHGPIICFRRTSHSTTKARHLRTNQGEKEGWGLKSENGSWFHTVGCMMPCLPAFQTNHHFHMRLKFGATFRLRVDSVTPSAPYPLLRAHIYFLPGSQTITPTKSGAMRICTCEWIFLGVRTFYHRGERLQRQGDHSEIAALPQRSPPKGSTPDLFYSRLLLFFLLPLPPFFPPVFNENCSPFFFCDARISDAIVFLFIFHSASPLDKCQRQSADIPRQKTCCKTLYFSPGLAWLYQSVAF